MIGVDTVVGKEATRTRLNYVAHVGRPWIGLNPDVGAAGSSSRRSHNRLLTVAVGLGALPLFAAPLALMEPSYVKPIASPDYVLDRLTSAMQRAGVAQSPAPAETATRPVACQRSSSWLWGDSGGVAQIEVTAGAAIQAGTEAAVRQRLDAKARALPGHGASWLEDLEAASAARASWLVSP